MDRGLQGVGGAQPISAFLGLLVGLLSLPVIGEVLLRALRTKRGELSRMERLVVAFGLGNAAVVLQMFFFSLANVPLARWTLVVPWILIGGILLYGWWRGTPLHSLGPASSSLTGTGSRWPSSGRYAWAWWEVLLVLAIALAVLDVFLATLTTPFLYSDATWFWTPKAKIFYQHRFIPFAAFRDLTEFVHPDYPLLLPLTEAWLFLWMGEVNEYFMKLISPVYMVLLVLAVWAFVGRLFGRPAALVAAGLLATTPFVLHHGTTGFADLPLAFYSWLAVALVLVWFQTPQPRLLLLAAVFLGLTGWVKNEGLGLILVSGCVFPGYLAGQERSGSRETLRATLLFGGVALGVVLPWLFVRYSLGLESDLSLPPLATVLPMTVQRVWPIAKVVATELFAFSRVLTTWNLAWYLLLLVVIFHRRALWRSLLRYPVLITAGQVFVYVGVYLITPYNVDWHVRSSLERLLLQLYPLAVVVIGWCIGAEVSGPDRFELGYAGRGNRPPVVEDHGLGGETS